MNRFLEKLNSKEMIIFDGGMGSMLQKYGVEIDKYPEMLNFTHSDIVENIHRQYLDNGADIISVNTFGANTIKSNGCGKNCVELTNKAIDIANKVQKDYPNCMIALDIGPTGHLIKPLGDISFNDAYNAFAEQAIEGEKSGADLVIIETMSDIRELKCAILAVKENTNLPIVASATYSENLRMLSGSNVETVIALLESLKVDVVGFNCGVGLDVAKKIIDQYLTYSSTPILSQPNAGLPVINEDGSLFYPATSEEFGTFQIGLAEKGVQLLGGCCGTTPDHINYLAKNKVAHKILLKNKTSNYISSYNKCYDLDKADVSIGKELTCENPEIVEMFENSDIDGLMDYIYDMQDDDFEAILLNLNSEKDISTAIYQLIEEIQSVCSLPLIFNIKNINISDRVAKIYNGIYKNIAI